MSEVFSSAFSLKMEERQLFPDPSSGLGEVKAPAPGKDDAATMMQHSQEKASSLDEIEQYVNQTVEVTVHSKETSHGATGNNYHLSRSSGKSGQNKRQRTEGQEQVVDRKIAKQNVTAAERDSETYSGSEKFKKRKKKRVLSSAALAQKQAQENILQSLRETAMYEVRMRAERTWKSRTFAFLLVVVSLVAAFPSFMATIRWEKKFDLLSQNSDLDGKTISLGLNLEECSLRVISLKGAGRTLQVIVGMIALPWPGAALAEERKQDGLDFSVEVALRSLGLYDSVLIEDGYLMCEVVVALGEDLPDDYVHLHINARKTAFEVNSLSSRIGHISFNGENSRVRISKSTTSSGTAPIRSLSFDMEGPDGGIDMELHPGYDSIEIKTRASDVFIRSEHPLVLESLVQPFGYYVVSADCISRNHLPYKCLDGATMQTNTSHYLFPGNISTPSGGSMQRSGTSAPKIAIESATGSIYVDVGVDAESALRTPSSRQVFSGLPRPMLSPSSQASLESIKSWLSEAPDDDSLIIINVLGDPVPQRKWLYATRKPFLELEPAYWDILSAGVLVPRLRIFDISLVAGFWPCLLTADARYPIRGEKEYTAQRTLIGNNSMRGTMTSTNTSGNNSSSARVSRSAHSLSDATWADLSFADIAGDESPELHATLYIYALLLESIGLSTGRSILAYKDKNSAIKYSLSFNKDGAIAREKISIEENRNLVLALILAAFIATLFALFSAGVLRYYASKKLKRYIFNQINDAHSSILSKEMKNHHSAEEDKKALARHDELEKVERRNDRHGHNDTNSKAHSDSPLDDTRTGLRKRSMNFLDARSAPQLFDETCSEDMKKNIAEFDFNAEEDEDDLRISRGRSQVFRLQQREIVEGKAKSNRMVTSATIAVALCAVGFGCVSAAGSGNYKQEDFVALLVTGIATLLLGIGIIVFQIVKYMILNNLKWGDSNQKLDNDKAISKRLRPSPFELPEILLRSVWQSRRNSLEKFLRSEFCILKPEKKFWKSDIPGESTIASFQQKYSQFCDDNECRQLLVLKQTSTLARHGILLKSTLVEIVRGLRRATRYELEKWQRKNDQNSLFQKFFGRAVRTWRDVPCKICRPQGLNNWSPKTRQKLKRARGGLSSSDMFANTTTCATCGNFLSAKSRRQLLSRRIQFSAYKHLLYETGLFVATGNDADSLSFADLQDISLEYFMKMSGRGMNNSTKQESTNPAKMDTSAKSWSSCCCFRRPKVKPASTTTRKGRRKTVGDFMLQTAKSLKTNIVEACDAITGNESGDEEKDEQGAPLCDREYVRDLICCNNLIKPIHIILDDTDSKLGGLNALAREEIYALSGVEMRNAEDLKTITDLAKQTRKSGTVGNFLSALIYVLICSVFCLCVPLPLAILALRMQEIQKRTTAVRIPLSVNDLVFRPFDSDVLQSRHISAEVAIFFGLLLTFYAISTVKLFMFFIGVERSSLKRRIIRLIFVTAANIYVILMLFTLFNALLWIILGAVLNPVTIMPYSVAIAGSVTFCTSKYRDALKARDLMAKRVQKKLDRLLAKVVSKSSLARMYQEFQSHKKNVANTLKRQRISREMNAVTTATAAAAAAAANAANATTTAGTSLRASSFLQKPTSAKLSPAQIFQVYDKDGSRTMEPKEFLLLLEDLQLTISQSRALRIFSAADKGGNGALTVDEFKSAWENLTSAIARDAMANAGVTNTTIAKAVTSAIAILALLFAFIFFAVGAFGSMGSFGSGIRGLMVMAGARLGGNAVATKNPDDEEETKATEDALAVLTKKVFSHSSGDAQAIFSPAVPSAQVVPSTREGQEASKTESDKSTGNVGIF